MFSHAEYDNEVGRATETGRWLREIWLYAGILFLVAGGGVVAATGEVRLLVPVGGVCFGSALIGSLMAVLRAKSSKSDQRPSIFR